MIPPPSYGSLEYYIPCVLGQINGVSQPNALPLKGRNGKIIEQSGVSRVGELTRVIMDLYYRKVLDTFLEARCPGIRYSRWYNELFIAIEIEDNDNEEIIDNIENIINDFEYILHINQLEGGVQAIHHLDGDYLDCHNQERVVILLKDGTVEVSDFCDD